MQDEPLPHELRPPHVLQMTMDYLVTIVINHDLRGSGEWFNFIWNRTRAVRKVKDRSYMHICVHTKVHTHIKIDVHVIYNRISLYNIYAHLLWLN